MSSSVEQIKSRLNIVDVIQGYVKLERAGVNFKARCPFHNEKTPSFFVSPIRQTWHCFGCNRGGDMFSFVMEIEGVEFIEALKILADRAGVSLEPFDKKYKDERSRILKLMEEAKNFYIEGLKKNLEAKNYLLERGLKEETIKDFGIGFAPPEWRGLLNYLRNKNYSDKEIEKAGMLVRSDKGIYDRFRGRIMFPIFDGSGRVVGFSGRIFGGGKKEEETAKYINTPQTIIYDKSKILYGFDRAKDEIRRTNKCILVEGQMDLIMSHQAGVKNAVAVSGTALTDYHLNIIKRLSDNIIMAFDKDEAGLAAAKRAIDMALLNDLEVKIAVIPFGKDPADTIKNNPDVWITAVNNSKNIFDFYLDLLEKIESPQKKIKEIQETILPRLAVLTSEIKRAYWIKEIADRLKIKEEAVWEEMKKIKKEERTGVLKEERKNNFDNRLQMIENRLIGFILWKREDNDDELKSLVNDLVKEFSIDLERWSPDLKDKFVFEAEILYGGGNYKEEFKNLALEYRKEKARQELAFLGEKIKELELKMGSGGLASDEAILLKDYLDKFNKLTKNILNYEKKR